MKHEWILLLLLAGVLAGCGKIRSGSESPIVAIPPPIVKVAKPVRRAVTRVAELPGDVEAYEQANLYAKVSGYLSRIFVDKGDKVSAGETLALIEAPEMKRNLAQAEEAYLASQSAEASAESRYADSLFQVRKALASLADAREELTLAKATYHRLKKVSDKNPGMIPEEDLDVARTNQEQSFGKVAERTAEVKAARAHAASVQSEKTQTTYESRAGSEALEEVKALLEYTVIRAPFAGIITRRSLDPGALVQSATTSAQGNVKPLLVLADFSVVRIYAHVPEPDVPYVIPGTPAEVESGTRSYNASVTRTSQSLDLSTRTMLAEIDLANPDHFLKPGMYARITFTLQKRRGALAVPTGAVLFEKSKRFVFVVRDQKALKVQVETGFVGPEWTEILKGLTREDRVIVSGKENVQDGASVQISR